MPKPNWILRGAAISLLAILAGGLIYFAGLRPGNSYPRFSSLNSGPLGAKLTFDALSELPVGFAVTRNRLAFARWRPQHTAILYLAASADRFWEKNARELAALERLTQPDNRLVLSFVENEYADEEPPTPPIAFETRWGMRLRYKKANEEHVTLVAQPDGSWKPVEGLRDTWEKRFGGGSVVVSLHGEQFSNQNMADATTAASILPILLGNYRNAAFEETHLGIEESGSIAGLARRYRLQGFAAGLLLVTVLFLWNRSVSFPPAPEQPPGGAAMQGEGTRGLYAGLLARHLSGDALMEACVSEWNRVQPKQRIPAGQANGTGAVARYRDLQEELERNGKL